MAIVVVAISLVKFPLTAPACTLVVPRPTRLTLPKWQTLLKTPKIPADTLCDPFKALHSAQALSFRGDVMRRLGLIGCVFIVLLMPARLALAATKTAKAPPSPPTDNSADKVDVP